MLIKEADLQFRDNIFLSRTTLTLDKHPRPSHRIIPIPIPTMKISRSTWTKKLKKHHEHQSKIGVQNCTFENRLQGISPGKNTTTPRKLYKFSKMADTSRDQYPHPHETTLNKQRLRPPLPFHFSPNRNVYNQSLHEDLSVSGILLEKIENDHNLTLMHNKSSKNSRKFLKSLKLKNSLNLFKGNFSKFTKNDIIHCVKSKRFNLTADLERLF